MRRPSSLELHLPAASVGRYLNRLAAFAAVAVLLKALLSWASVRDTLEPWAQLVLMALMVGVPAALLLAATNTHGGRTLRALLLPPEPEAWLLRYDGQHWHWWALSHQAQAAGAESVEPACGTGLVQLALTIGPFWLLKASPMAERGRTAWIWVSSSNLGASGLRLRTMLAWSS